MTTFTGKTVDDAIQKGLKSLEIKSSEAEINIIQVNRRGFLGIGRRNAKVQVAKKPENEHNLKNDQTSKNKNEKINYQKEEQEHEEEKNVSQKAADNYGQDPENQKNDSKYVIDMNDRDYDDGLYDYDEYDDANETVEDTFENPHPATKDDAINDLIDYLDSIVTQLGITASINIDEQNSKHVKLDFETDKEGLLIGRHGLTINALQELSQIYLNRFGVRHFYLELDTANYRERRMEVLEGLAKRTARKVVANGKPVYLDPMPSFERKRIHATLAHSEHVMTYSAGREPHRAVVVAPH